MHYNVIKQSGHLRTVKECTKHSPVWSCFLHFPRVLKCPSCYISVIHGLGFFICEKKQNIIILSTVRDTVLVAVAKFLISFVLNCVKQLTLLLSRALLLFCLVLRDLSIVWFQKISISPPRRVTEIPRGRGE